MLRSTWITVLMLCVTLTGCKSSADQPGESASGSAAAAPAALDAAAPAGPPFKRFPTAAQAVQSLLARHPRVVGFGEYHQKIGSAAVKTSLTRFRTEILPAIAGAGSDLVLETWVEAPRCGKKAAAVSKDVQKTIARPPETESELVALLRVAEKLKLKRHMLTMSCDDLASFRKDKEVDYDALLQVITRRLAGAVEKVLAASSASDRPVAPAIFVYGGSMHNEVHPFAGTEAYSYVERVNKALGEDGNYIEIDLFVPELIADSDLFASQAWFPLARREAKPDSVMVFERSPSSYIIILRRNVAP